MPSYSYSTRRPRTSRKRDRETKNLAKKKAAKPEKLLARLYRSMPSDATQNNDTPLDKRRKNRHSHDAEKYTTRGINALEFLRSVPLEAENSLNQQGMMMTARGTATLMKNGSSPLSPPPPPPPITAPTPTPKTPWGRLKSLIGMNNPTTSMPSVSHTPLPQSHSVPSNETQLADDVFLRSFLFQNLNTPASKADDEESLELENPDINNSDGSDDNNRAITDNGNNLFENLTTQQSIEQARKSTTRTFESHPNMTTARAPGRRLAAYVDSQTISLPEKLVSTPILKTLLDKNSDKTKTDREKLESARSVEWRTFERNITNNMSGRMFFSSHDSYPLMTFSVIKYNKTDQEKEEKEKLRLLKGGGGLKFKSESRDWRGVSYAAVIGKEERELVRKKKADRKERRKKRVQRWKRRLEEEEEGDGQAQVDEDEEEDDDENNDHTDDDLSSSSASSLGSLLNQFSSSDSDSDNDYTPGYLDDPEITVGRHRHVMIGDKNIGPIASSVLQYVEPQALKAELNKQFRSRFDDYEPSDSRKKFINGRVIDGAYTLWDPDSNLMGSSSGETRSRDEFASMPPSLTLSKIRSLKQQALLGAIKAGCEVSTVALCCVYFERLCLSCLVDKNNRRLVFGSCLLIAYKLNEPHLAVETAVHEENERVTSRTKVKTTSSSNNSLSLLIEFLATSWKLNPKELFEAEFGCFVALEFKTHASPSQVAFHFRRLMRSLEKDSARYLGHEMWSQWQEALKNDAIRENRREARRRKKKERSERKILRLERKLTLKSKFEEGLRLEDERHRKKRLDVVDENYELDSEIDTASEFRRKSSAVKIGFLSKLFKGGPATAPSISSAVSSKTNGSDEKSSGGEDPLHREGEEEEV